MSQTTTEMIKVETSETNNSDDGIDKVLLYAISGGSAALIIIMGLIIIFLCQRRRPIKENPETGDDPKQYTDNKTDPKYENIRESGVYDELNEKNMLPGNQLSPEITDRTEYLGLVEEAVDGSVYRKLETGGSVSEKKKLDRDSQSISGYLEPEEQNIKNSFLEVAQNENEYSKLASESKNTKYSGLSKNAEQNLKEEKDPLGVQHEQIREGEDSSLETATKSAAKYQEVNENLPGVSDELEQDPDGYLEPIGQEGCMKREKEEKDSDYVEPTLQPDAKKNIYIQPDNLERCSELARDSVQKDDSYTEPIVDTDHKYINIEAHKPDAIESTNSDDSGCVDSKSYDQPALDSQATTYTEPTVEGDTNTEADRSKSDEYTKSDDIGFVDSKLYDEEHRQRSQATNQGEGEDPKPETEVPEEGDVKLKAPHNNGCDYDEYVPEKYLEKPVLPIVQGYFNMNGNVSYTNDTSGQVEPYDYSYTYEFTPSLPGSITSDRSNKNPHPDDIDTEYSSLQHEHDYTRLQKAHH